MESHKAHFWLVLTAALVTLGLAYGVGVAAQRRRDGAAGVDLAGVHGELRLPGAARVGDADVLLGKNAGFELATPVGLVIAGGFAAASAVELTPSRAEIVMRRSRALLIGLLVVLASWCAISVTETWPLARPLGGEQLSGWQVFLAVIGVGLFAAAALGYFRLYLRRREPFVVVVTFAFVLLSEAMVVIAWARNWHVSWWEWHVLMLLAFVVIVLAVRHEWHEERFSALYLDQTLAGAQGRQHPVRRSRRVHRVLVRDAARSGRADAERVLRPHHPADGGGRW